MKEKLIAKIKALLNRTVENGASLSEAEIALKKANELIAKHHITEFELKNFSQKEECEEVKIKFKRISNHIKSLFASVADAFECEYCYNTHFGTFFGYKTDIIIAEHIFNFVLSALEYEISEYKKTYDYQDDISVYSPNKVVNSFIGGFVAKIEQKLLELTKEKEDIVQHVTGTSLICLKKQALTTSFNLKHPNIKISVLKTAPSLSSAYRAGLESAENYNLNRPLETNDTQKLIGA